MLKQYIGNFNKTGKIGADVSRFFTQFGFQKTAQHCADVAAKAKELAHKFNSNPVKAEQAGYLHDISAIIPNEMRIEVAQSQKIDILAEEIQCPMIIHQKLSVVLAKEAFGINDKEVLSAVGCHTTLKVKATKLDKVLFLADKIAWDQEGTPPYIDNVNKAVETSLDAAVLEYLNYLWGRRNQLQVIHPWFVEAREYLHQNQS